MTPLIKTTAPTVREAPRTGSAAARSLREGEGGGGCKAADVRVVVAAPAPAPAAILRPVRAVLATPAIIGGDEDMVCLGSTHKCSRPDLRPAT